MKKRILTAFAALLLLLTALTSALAAEDDGLMWYIEDWGKLYISTDGGVSYAELPGLGERQAQTGQDYTNTTTVTALPSGGLRVEARDRWETENTFRRDYSAAEVSAALEKAVPTPVRVLCTNGQGMTLGQRNARDTENAPLTGDIMGDWRYTQWNEQLVCSTDGVTWQAQPWPEGMGGVEAAWWDGTAFHLYDGTKYTQVLGATMGTWVHAGATSPDGLHWTVWERETDGDDPAISRQNRSRVADLGPYHFELYGGEVYLMRQGDWDTGVLLPHMGEGLRAIGSNGYNLMAWYGPGDTVFLTACDGYLNEELAYTLNYPISSLDWCLENLSVPFREPEKNTQNATGTVSLATDGWYSVRFSVNLRELLRNDGSGWKRVTDVPFSAKFDLLPYNGKTFVVVDQRSGELWFSEDGLSWTATDAVRPSDWEPGTYNRIECATAWTGKGYLVGRKAWEYGHGPMSGLGGSWFEGNTKVYFLDESLRLTDTYDFGRLVQAVGSYDGSYYAKVSDSTGDNQRAGDDNRLDWTAGSTLYTSKDGKTWTPLSDLYLNVDELFVPSAGGEKRGNLPTGDPKKPLRSVAQLDNWRFILYERVEGYFDVYLMRGNANDMAYLGLEEEIKSRWITPGELSAAYTADGNVRLTVRDMSTPAMEYSVTYTPQELDAMRDGGEGDWTYRGNWSVEEQQGNGADVALMQLINGEREVAYRNGSTGGKYMYLENVPWSNSVELLEYSGKDFMLLDKADGKVYLSADGRTWREAAGEWIVGNRKYDAWSYSICWAGDHYIAGCALEKQVGGSGRHLAAREYAEDSLKIILLDEDLNKIGECIQEGFFLPGRVGVRNGVCYAADSGYGSWRSTDGGRTWTQSDLGQVNGCLRALGPSL